jgi:ketosteroid isomerase-like protein
LKKQGLRIRRFALQDQRIWLAGHRHYQVARYQVDHTLPGQKEIVHAFYSGLTVRERQSDGVFRIKLTAYNQTAAPAKRSDLGYSAPWGQGGVEVCPTLHGMPLPEDYLIEEIQEIEEAFYVFLVDGQTQRAARCYADDATLIVQGQPVHQGKEAVGRALIRESGAAAPITGVEREILQLEGDERMVYVVSQLRWAMRDPNTGDPFVTEGKGVHVWQRQADYSWKLLVDVTNRDGPSDE